jgi:hypothetical protein
MTVASVLQLTETLQFEQCRSARQDGPCTRDSERKFRPDPLFRRLESGKLRHLGGDRRLAKRDVYGTNCNPERIRTCPDRTIDSKYRP